MQIEHQDHYDEWVEDIAQTWQEDYDGSEDVLTVARACVMTHILFDIDDGVPNDRTLTTTGEPWVSRRAYPASVLNWTDAPAEVFDTDDGFREDSVKALAHDIHQASQGLESGGGFRSEDFDDLDQIAFDAYHDGERRHEVDEPVTGVVGSISRSGTLLVSGIGSVNVEPEDVVEIVEKADDDKDQSDIPSHSIAYVLDTDDA